LAELRGLELGIRRSK